MVEAIKGIFSVAAVEIQLVYLTVEVFFFLKHNLELAFKIIFKIMKQNRP